MPGWVWWAGAAVVVLVVADRLLLAAEARRWINYRKSPPRKGTAAQALLTLQYIFEPDKKHVMEEQAREEDAIEREASGDPPIKDR